MLEGHQKGLEGLWATGGVLELGFLVKEKYSILENKLSRILEYNILCSLVLLKMLQWHLCNLILQNKNMVCYYICGQQNVVVVEETSSAMAECLVSTSLLS